MKTVFLMILTAIGTFIFLKRNPKVFVKLDDSLNTLKAKSKRFSNKVAKDTRDKRKEVLEALNEVSKAAAMVTDTLKFQ